MQCAVSFKCRCGELSVGVRGCATGFCGRNFLVQDHKGFPCLRFTGLCASNLHGGITVVNFDQCLSCANTVSFGHKHANYVPRRSC